MNSTTHYTVILDFAEGTRRGEEFDDNVRSQEKILNQNRDSNLEPPDF